MKDSDYDTNMGWWTDKPDRETRPSALAPLSGAYLRKRRERVWLKSILIVALMTAFGLSLLHMAR